MIIYEIEKKVWQYIYRLNAIIIIVTTPTDTIRRLNHLG